MERYKITQIPFKGENPFVRQVVLSRRRKDAMEVRSYDIKNQS